MVDCSYNDEAVRTKAKPFASSSTCFVGNSPIPRTWLSRGMTSLKGGRMDEALSMFNKAIEGNGDDVAEAYSGKGRVYQLRGRMYEAYNNYCESLRIRKDGDTLKYRSEVMTSLKMPRIYSQIDTQMAHRMTKKGKEFFDYSAGYEKYICGLDHYKSRDYQEAIRELTAAIKLDICHHPSYYCRAMSFLKIARPEAAIKDFGVVLHIEEKHAHAYAYRALALMRTKQMDRAMKDAEYATRLDSNVAMSFVVMGYINMDHRNMPREAVDNFMQAVGLKHNNAYYHLGLAHWRNKEYISAIQVLDTAIKGGSSQGIASGVMDTDLPLTRSFINMANVSMKESKSTKSAVSKTEKQPMASYDCILFNDRVVFDSLKARAQIKMRHLKDFEGAIVDLQRVIKLDYDADSVNQSRMLRAEALMQKGKMGSAQEDLNYCTEYLEGKKPQVAMIVKVAFLRSKVLSHLDDDEGAIEDLGRVLMYDKENSAAFFRRGSILLKHKVYDMAIRDFERAIELKPRDHDAYLKAAIAYHEFDRQELAESRISVAAELCSDNDEIYEWRGIIRETRGNLAEAIEDYGRALQILQKRPANIRNLEDERALVAKMISAQNNEGLRLFDSGQGDIQGAITAFSSTIQHQDKIGTPDAVYYENRAAAYMAGLYYKNAVDDLSTALNISNEKKEVENEELSRIRLERGLAYIGLHKFENALEDIVFSLKADPTNYGAHEGMGILCMKKPNPEYDMAIEYFTQALKEMMADDRAASVFRNRAEAYMHVKRYEEALDDISCAEKCVGEAGMSRLYYSRSQIYCAMAEFTGNNTSFNETQRRNYLVEALKFVERAIQFGMQQYEVYMHKAKIQVLRKDYNDAINVLTTAYENTENINSRVVRERQVDALGLRADIYVKRGVENGHPKDLSRAVRDLDEALKLDSENPPSSYRSQAHVLRRKVQYAVEYRLFMMGQRASPPVNLSGGSPGSPQSSRSAQLAAKLGSPQIFVPEDLNESFDMPKTQEEFARIVAEKKRRVKSAHQQLAAYVNKQRIVASNYVQE